MRKRQVIECKVPDNIFKIGHSVAKSETFVPNSYYDAKMNLMLTDVPGLNDTDGVLIEIINNLMIKHIFKKARRVRFLIPISI